MIENHSKSLFGGNGVITKSKYSSNFDRISIPTIKYMKGKIKVYANNQIKIQKNNNTLTIII